MTQSPRASGLTGLSFGDAVAAVMLGKKATRPRWKKLGQLVLMKKKLWIVNADTGLRYGMIGLDDIVATDWKVI